MCKQYIKIKSKNQYNVTYGWIPCGICSECRKKQANEWTVRLKAEIEEYHVNQNYNLGFFTLTYNDQHLPHIPKKFFDKDKYEKIPCFSYYDIKKFTDTIRGYLFREYNIKDGFRYFITSEYGEKFHRPHYHGIIIFDKRLDHKTMYEIMEDAWCGTTKHIPNNKKRHTKRKNLGIIAPFETFIPRDNYATGSYVAKYVCKDIEFQKTTENKFIKLGRKMKNDLRHWCPFHKQSLGFGACLIKNKSEKELLKMLNEGITFTGNPKMIELPVYIKNKILFNPYKCYNIKTHKYETIKRYSKFFYDNKEEIFNKKYNTNRKIIAQYATREFWESFNLNNEQIMDYYMSCKNVIDNYGLNEIAYFNTLYYGLSYNNCYEYENPADGLFARYNPIADHSEKQHIDSKYFQEYTNVLSWIFSTIRLNQDKLRNKKDEHQANIRSFWQNMLHK